MEIDLEIDRKPYLVLFLDVVDVAMVIGLQG